jgi:hypothetical protein
VGLLRFVTTISAERSPAAGGAEREQALAAEAATRRLPIKRVTERESLVKN